ncbi:methylenetetrahydrofolate reductase (NADPH)-like [Condylostylus longicornis]|uniref:methylenetetrahydrofolate reductase (NADPH)-like n=1 Tax=Condylostylus longicornis TaxID=2530218 RepID=UPI00244E4FF3|nr:methylenetetrahydrofolate reductase (NADPH)-like [Condylostylus longicornis]
MCRQLLLLGVPGLHFYTLNLEVSVMKIVDLLDILDVHLPNRELPWRGISTAHRRSRKKISGSKDHSMSQTGVPELSLPESPLIGMSEVSSATHTPEIGTPLVDALTTTQSRESADLGQREDLLLNYMNEDVRPIFWSNRPKSYIHRTANWDDFPNGRWGPRDSPAYGEPFYSMCVAPDERSIQARREMWGEELESVDDVVKIFVNYLKFQNPTKRLPWTNENLGEETQVIKKQLIKLNTLGICTINSQPRVNAALSTDPLFGWGPSGGFVFQKSYIEFFCSPDLWNRIHSYLTTDYKSQSLSFMALNQSGQMTTNVQTFGGKSGVNAVTWGVFPNAEIRQPTIVDLDSFNAWKAEAFQLWQVEWASIYDEGSPSRVLIDQICNSWYLVNIVDNNFLSGDLFGQLIEIVQEH